MQLNVAVVEDINDPLKCGRVRARIIGLHTPDKFKLPTDQLPWAMVLNNTASVSGIGTTGCNFLPGSWVIVSSIDGDSW